MVTLARLSVNEIGIDSGIHAPFNSPRESAFS